jgi:hypothetical protein
MLRSLLSAPCAPRLLSTLLPALVLLSGAPAAANEACARIPDDAARLACYDDAWRTPAQNAARWVVREEVSAFDGSAGLVAEIPAEAPFTDRFGAPARARLGLACREGGVQAWVHFGGAYMSDRVRQAADTGAPPPAGLGGPRMSYRLDEGAPELREFQVANDRRALGFWTDRAARLFLDELAGHARLSVRAAPFRTQPVTAVFDLSRLPGVLRRVRTACPAD